MAARDYDYVNKKVTPTQAVKVLEKNGLQVSEKEAVKILDFLYFIGKLTVNQHIKDNTPGGDL
jgi:hypothetical protein